MARHNGQMLTIRRDLVDAMIAHARADHPDEACGVIAGAAGSDVPARFIPMANAARSTTFYEFDSGDLLRLYREMDANDEEPVVVYAGLSLAHGHQLRSRAQRPLRAGLDPLGAGHGGPQLPHHRRRGDRGAGADRRVRTLVPMAIEVQIPTILRTYTGGDKIVSADGATLADLVADLDAKFPGLRDRVVDDAGLRRFVNVYLNDEDVRFLDGLATTLSDGDSVTILPAVAGG